MKNRILNMLLLLPIIFGSCISEEKTPDTNLNDISKNYSLISPKGFKIADNEKSLIEKLGFNLTKDSKSKLEFNIEEIEYFEGEKYSYSSISVYVGSKFYSVFLINEIEDNKIILQDEHTIKIVDKNKIIEGKGDILSFSKTNVASKFGPGTGFAKCLSGQCCRWETVIEGVEYNCGCPEVMTSIIITTSDGCKVEL